MLEPGRPEIDAAVIGGVGFRPEEFDFNTVEVDTPYGTVVVNRGNITHQDRTIELAFILRHANEYVTLGEHLPPHRLNYRAIICAAKKLGAQRVLATNSVGSMVSHTPGSFLVPDDFIDLTRSRANTFFDNSTLHVDMTEPYCHQIRDSLLKALANNHMEQNTGVYVCTEGPRFETAAEIRMLKCFGDVVGMTGLPEVVLAKELGLCYASLCIITNKACGLAGKKLTADEVLEMLEEKQQLIMNVLLDAIVLLPSRRTCRCEYATRGARVP